MNLLLATSPDTRRQCLPFLAVVDIVLSFRPWDVTFKISSLCQQKHSSLPRRVPRRHLFFQRRLTRPILYLVPRRAQGKSGNDTFRGRVCYHGLSSRSVDLFCPGTLLWYAQSPLVGFMALRLEKSEVLCPKRIFDVGESGHGMLLIFFSRRRDALCWLELGRKPLATWYPCLVNIQARELKWCVRITHCPVQTTNLLSFYASITSCRLSSASVSWITRRFWMRDVSLAKQTHISFLIQSQRYSPFLPALYAIRRPL